MEQNTYQTYAEAVMAIKSAILQSRYQAARSINREAISLYYHVGKYISEHSRNDWGTGAIAAVSNQLQQELPGLRGFSEGNMRKMRIFYETWQQVFEFCASSTHELSEDKLQSFLAVPFTHHYEIIKKTSSLQERLFYIELVAKEFWSVEKLQYFLKEKLFDKQASMPNNFNRTISVEEQQQRANNTFRSEYLLDFLTIEDPDDYDEKKIELPANYYQALKQIENLKELL